MCSSDLGVRRTRVDDDRADRMATLDELHQQLGSADVVVLACPLTEETRGLADAAFFDAMRPGAIVVNVSRGPVVDTAALLEALDRGNPSTAILDVFDVEPLAEDLLDLRPTRALHPHASAARTNVAGLRFRGRRREPPSSFAIALQPLAKLARV